MQYANDDGRIRSGERQRVGGVVSVRSGGGCQTYRRPVYIREPD